MRKTGNYVRSIERKLQEVKKIMYSGFLLPDQNSNIYFGNWLALNSSETIFFSSFHHSGSGQVAAEEPKEEVFAESYDNDDKGDRGRGGGSNATITSATVSSNLDTLDTGFPGCPNKWNVYHSCVLACQHR